MVKGYNPEDKVFLALDCIIFGFDDEDLKVLLIRRDFEPEIGKWSLMGGFMKNDETLNDAAARILHRLTGMHDIYMEQLYTFSEVDRDPVTRTVSTAYYAIVNIEKYNEELIENFNGEWFSLKKAPKLIFDHNEMVEKAVKRLRRRTSISPIGFELLPEKFTMRQLQKLYEAILGKKIDKRNFTNKIKSMDILIKLDEKDMSSSTKGSYLHMFDQEKYKSKQENNFYLKL
ncbi:NUDIX domain-containing protein [Gaetbulibacter sp. M240]|uniref:NUDIX hydrolase n=1 Tax=Gaetbulibacter sp. M240 TaxID=3126511 RepID=UPI00374F0F3F